MTRACRADILGPVSTCHFPLGREAREGQTVIAIRVKCNKAEQNSCNMLAIMRNIKLANMEWDDLGLVSMALRGKCDHVSEMISQVPFHP